MLAAGALVLALVSSSVANSGRASLRCVDGQLVPHRGRLLPVGEQLLEDGAFPPVPVSPAACEDEEFEDFETFEARYVELFITPNAASASASASEGLRPETAVEAIEAIPEGGGEKYEPQRRALLEQTVRDKVERARRAQQDALHWIERARRAGVDPSLLRAAERSLGLDPGPAEAPAPRDAARQAQPEPEPGDAPLLRPVSDALPPASRAL